MKKTIILVMAVSLGTLLMAQNIVEGEYFFDSKKEYGEGTPITVQNPTDDISIDLDIPVNTLPEGLHRLFVRFKDSNGRWGQTLNYTIFIKHEEVANIIAGEYFFDEVGDYGEGSALNLSAQAPMSEVMQELPVDDLPGGLHRLFVRFKDSDGLWSHTLNFNVFIKHKKLIVIEGGEYFFDNIVGYGEGFPIAVDSVANYTTATDFIAAPNNLSVGQHIMYYRFKDSNGLWSHTYSEAVCVGVVDGKYMTDATSYCFGDTVFFDYTGNIPANAVYSWDLNNDGNFSDMQTDGSPFFHIPDVIENDTAVFRYRIMSNLCPVWQKEGSLKVEVSPAMDIDQSVSDITCFGICDGVIDISVNGGIPPYFYQWSNGSNQQDQNGLCSGMFNVAVTNTAGCISIDSFIIEEPDALSVLVDSVGNETAGQGNGFIEVTISGGMPPYNYEWRIGNTTISTDEDPAGLSAGIYSLVLIDANGCELLTGDIIVDNLVRVSDVGHSKILQSYPNPASTYITIDGQTTSKYQIFTPDGRVLKKGRLNEKNERIDLTGLPNGLLILKMENDHSVKSIRFVKN